jgi:hypothetical protein
MRVSATVDHDIARLEVAMNDAETVGRLEAGRDLSREVDRLGSWQGPDPPNERGEVLTVDVLHRHEKMLLPLDDIVEAANVRVGDLTAEANFLVKTLENLRRSGQLGANELESHRLSKSQIVGPVDLTHSATSEKRHDAVPLGKHGAGRKAGGGTNGSRGCGEAVSSRRPPAPGAEIGAPHFRPRLTRRAQIGSGRHRLPTLDARVRLRRVFVGHDCSRKLEGRVAWGFSEVPDGWAWGGFSGQLGVYPTLVSASSQHLEPCLDG